MARANLAVEPIADSALALARRTVEGEGTVGDPEADTLLFVSAGSGSITLGDETGALAAGRAALVLAGEEASVVADASLELVVVTVGPDVDRHAPLGPRELVSSLDKGGPQQASGARSFQILFDATNGSTRATLFAGFLPSGKAPWHYHLYDEIVFVPEGPARLHVGETTEELAARSAFRLRPREVHIVENTSSVRELTVIGIFTPAGSPSAAYLASDVVAASPFVG